MYIRPMQISLKKSLGQYFYLSHQNQSSDVFLLEMWTLMKLWSLKEQDWNESGSLVV